MKKVKKLVSETSYINCFCLMNCSMIRFYWSYIRIMEEPRDIVYNMLIGDGYNE